MISLWGSLYARNVFVFRLILQPPIIQYVGFKIHSVCKPYESGSHIIAPSTAPGTCHSHFKNFVWCGETGG